MRAMRLHGHDFRVTHAVCVCLWALCSGSHASDVTAEAKQQAAAAGALELIAAALQQKPPMLCVWNMGRAALVALVRDEPANRRRAKKALPRRSVCYSLWALSL